MAFWKPHANPVSWWSCRYWLLWINTAGPCGECRRCWKQWELCPVLPESWEQLTCKRTIFTLRPSTAENAPMRWFSIFFLVIIFLLITCGWTFSFLLLLLLLFNINLFIYYLLFNWRLITLQYWRFQCRLPGLIPVCPIPCLGLEPSFLEFSDSLSVWLCCPTLYKIFCTSTEEVFSFIRNS